VLTPGSRVRTARELDPPRRDQRRDAPPRPLARARLTAAGGPRRGRPTGTDAWTAPRSAHRGAALPLVRLRVGRRSDGADREGGALPRRHPSALVELSRGAARPARRARACGGRRPRRRRRRRGAEAVPRRARPGVERARRHARALQHRRIRAAQSRRARTAPLCGGARGAPGGLEPRRAPQTGGFVPRPKRRRAASPPRLSISCARSVSSAEPASGDQSVSGERRTAPPRPSEHGGPPTNDSTLSAPDPARAPDPIGFGIRPRGAQPAPLHPTHRGQRSPRQRDEP